MLLLSVVVEAVEEVRMEDEKCCDSCQLLACARILLTLVGPPIRMCMPGSGGALEQWKKRSPRGIRLGTTRRDSTGITTDVEAVCERSMSMQEQESRVIRRFCLPVQQGGIISSFRPFSLRANMLKEGGDCRLSAISSFNARLLRYPSQEVGTAGRCK